MGIWKICRRCLPLHSLLRSKPHSGEAVKIETLKCLIRFTDEKLKKS